MVRCARVTIPILVLTGVIAAPSPARLDVAQDPKQERPSTGNCSSVVYSNVRIVSENGDVIGTEILVVRCRNSPDVTGKWEEYEGSSQPASFPLTGTLVAGRLRLENQGEELKVALLARLSNRSLVGTLTTGEQVQNTKRLRLRRVEVRFEDRVTKTIDTAPAIQLVQPHATAISPFFSTSVSSFTPRSHLLTRLAVTFK